MPYVYLSHIRGQLGPTRLSYFLRRLDNISTEPTLIAKLRKVSSRHLRIKPRSLLQKGMAASRVVVERKKSLHISIKTSREVCENSAEYPSGISATSIFRTRSRYAPGV